MGVYLVYVVYLVCKREGGVLCVCSGVVAGNISACLYPLYNFHDNLRMRDKYTKYTIDRERQRMSRT